ncbi:polysaccharide biosynthesis protein [Clostridium sporogenes]|uniref:lipopolysaccharide biosynthesis protein n=1 Tax=Clostridium TaxID=1485 RepID=UPI00077FFEBA|nr:MULTISPECIES: oligosaccharide flippase family protein [Clostridium]KYN77506.1 polysaccharide biosynthesis protein [Clostridium sporogenes]MBE6056173.1 polysaccharide biosynthesis protein [Clostridium sp.]NFM17651.1 polysaccharide biosynthesis protein [Clostridium sporogenes]HDK7167322.1 oligosaccharide flippase family protein [Clostridium botulinum]
MLTKLKNIVKNNKLSVIFKYSFIKYIALIIGFLKEIVNARVLGPELLGVLGNLLLILNYLSYANLGILYSMNREYVLYKDKDETKAREVIDTSFTSLVILSIFFIICGFLSRLFMFKGVTGQYLVVIFFIGIFQQFKMFFINYFRLVDDFRKINFIELINNAGSFLLIILFIRDYKINAVLYSMVICGGITLIYGVINCEKLKISINYHILKDLINIGIPLLIYNLGFYILTTVDRIMILRYLNYEELGYYTFSNQIVSATLVFISSILFLYYPKAIKILNMNENFDKKKVYISTKEYTKYVELLGVLLCIVGVIFIKPFVNIVVPNYKPSINIYRILVVGTIATQICYFANVFIVSNRKQIYLILLQFVTIMLSIILNYIFLKLGFHVIGVSMATMITNIIYSVVQYFIFLKLLNQNKSSVNIILKTYYKFIIFVILLLIISILRINYYIYIISLLMVVFILYKKDINDVVKEYI